MRVKVILAILFILSACSFKNTPEGVLKEFINYRFKKSGQTKDGLLDYLTGPMHANYSQMTEEDVQKFTDLSGHRKKRLKINYKNCLESECSITYTLSYEVTDKDSKKTLAEVKRAAKLLMDEEEVWRIAEITQEGSKTHFEGKEPITPKDFKERYNVEADDIKLDSSGNPQYDESGKAITK